MRNFICILLCVVGLGACKEKDKFDGILNIEVDSVERTSKEITPENTGYVVHISYYRATEGPAYLKDSINKQTALFLSSWFTVSTRNFNIGSAVTSHLQDYFDRLKQLPNKDIHPTFNLNVRTEPIYQNKKIISLAYNWNIYEGGAHGYYSKWTLMLDKNTGSKISYKKLVKDETPLLEIAEKIFRKNIGVSENETLPDIYNFRGKKFHLSENFVFSTSGLVFYYNPYEIAPYSAGLIELVLPFSEIKDYINYLD